MRRSLRIQSTAKPKSNLSSTMVLPRLSVCQDGAAPLPIPSSTCFMSRPALRPKLMPSARPCARPAMQIWLTILVSWPEPAGPSRVTALAKCAMTGLAFSNGAASPPHITVSVPFSAPAWPPETGASMKWMPFFAAAANSSRAMLADAGKYDGCSLGGGFGRVGRLAAVLRHPAVGLGARAVVHRDFMAVLGQIAGHRKAHDAQAEECEFCHCVSPLLICSDVGRVLDYRCSRAAHHFSGMEKSRRFDDNPPFAYFRPP